MMYMHEPSEAVQVVEPLSLGLGAALVSAAIGTVLLGVFPSARLEFAGKSAVLVR